MENHILRDVSAISFKKFDETIEIKLGYSSRVFGSQGLSRSLDERVGRWAGAISLLVPGISAHSFSPTSVGEDQLYWYKIGLTGENTELIHIPLRKIIEAFRAKYNSFELITSIN